MALRGIAGDMARTTAGLWKAVAETVDPKPPRDTPRPSGAASPEPPATVDHESGNMVVPIDAWTRILEQVGHVHEAGQQLAEARERAARAETENAFLKEQLRELKAGRGTRRPAASTARPTPDPVAAVVPPVGNPRLRRAREAASRWIGPRAP